MQPASTKKGKGKGGPSASPALKVDVRSPVVLKMGAYWQYTQWFTLGSLVVSGVLFLLQNAKLQEMQSENVVLG